MTKKFLNKKIAHDNSVRDVCIDSEDDVWVKIRAIPPSKLMELEAMQSEMTTQESFAMVTGLIKEYLVEPRIVDEANDNPDELTIDELGGYFMALGTAVMGTVDPTGEVRSKAESFLENANSADGGIGGKNVPHAPVSDPGA